MKFILRLLVISFFISCSTSSDIETEKSSVSIQFSYRPATVKGIEVTKIIATLERNDFSVSNEMDLDGENASTTFNDLIIGEYTISVDMYDDTLIIASGTGLAIVEANKQNTANIDLEFVEGDLTIHVEWSSVKMLFYETPSIFDSFLYDETFEQLSNLGFGYYGFWIDDETYGINIDNNETLSIRDINNNEIDQYDLSSYGQDLQFGSYMRFTNQFIYHRNNNNGDYDLAVMNSDGSITTIYTDDISRLPIASAMDDWIYFHHQTSGQYHIMRIKPDGSQLDTVRSDPNYYYGMPTINYDGTKLAYFKRDEPNRTLRQIILYDIQSETETEILDVTESFGWISYPAFNKEGDKLYFFNDGDIYSVYLDGSQLKTVFDESYDVHRPRLW